MPSVYGGKVFGVTLAMKLAATLQLRDAALLRTALERWSARAKCAISFVKRGTQPRAVIVSFNGGHIARSV
jgi:hypothetical protein